MQNAQKTQKTKRNTRKTVKKDISEILKTLEEEIASYSTDSPALFVSEHGYVCKIPEDFVRLLQDFYHRSYSRTMILNSVKEMCGNLKHPQKTDNTELYFDSDYGFFRLNSPIRKNPYKDFRVTPLSIEQQCYIEVEPNTAPAISDFLNRIFQKNDIRTYAISHNLLLCLDLELGENQSGVKKKKIFMTRL